MKPRDRRAGGCRCYLQSKEIYIKYKKKEKTDGRKIRGIQIAQIRPFWRRWRDIEFLELTAENIVKVRLQDTVQVMPSAQMTIKGVVERILKRKLS